MIFLLLMFSCGSDVAPNKVADKSAKKAQRKERKKKRDEQYKVVIEDLNNTKNDMRCIKKYISVQQETPDEKIDYNDFEENTCEKIKDYGN